MRREKNERRDGECLRKNERGEKKKRNKVMREERER